MDKFELNEMKSEWIEQHSLEYERGKSIFRIKKQKLYHYTSLETMTAILENDQFRATQVRFSNDLEEYNAGKLLLKEFLDPAQERDCYMICFCQEADLLGQWREYARAGVSMELDFSRDSSFVIVKEGEQSQAIYAEPIGVIYAKYNLKEIETADQINLADIPIRLGDEQETLKIINSCIENFKKAVPEADDGFSLPDRIETIVPYIKNISFLEEKEVRLIFELMKSDRKMVCYMADERIGYRRPYINIRLGNSEKCGESVQKITLDHRINRDLYAKIQEYGGKSGIAIEELNDAYDINSIYIGTGSDENQEKVFMDVRRLVKNSSVSEECKVWCEGHWPVRSIMIGPSPNQSIIAESVAHFLKSKYWLSYVDVKCSAIPYREKKFQR